MEAKLRIGRQSEEWAANVRLSRLELVVLTRQLAAMLGAGVPLLKCLEVLAEQAEGEVATEILWTIRDTVEQGTYLSKACAQFRRVFPPVYITMLRVGERSGALILCLERLAGWLERDHRLASRLISSLTYPALVMVLMVVLTLSLYTWVLPPFFQVLEGFRITLPLPTRIVMFLSRSARNPGAWLCAAGLGLLVYDSFRFALRHAAWRQRVWAVLDRLPGIRRVLRCYTVARFSAALSALLQSGNEVLASWALACEASGDPRYQAEAPALVRRVQEGELPSVAMAARPDLFSSDLVQLLAAGEETGRVPKMLDVLCYFYEEELEVGLGTLSTLLQPVLLLIVSGILTVTMVSVFLPLYAYLNKF